VLVKPGHIFRREYVFLCIKVRILITNFRIPEALCK